MQDNNKRSTNMDSTKLQKISEQSNSDRVPKQKLIEELRAYRKVLEQERDRSIGGGDKNTLSKLAIHLQSVNRLIDDIGTKGLKGVLEKAQANETEVTKGLGELNKQVTAKLKKPDSLKSIIDEIPKKLNNLFKI